MRSVDGFTPLSDGVVTGTFPWELLFSDWSWTGAATTLFVLTCASSVLRWDRFVLTDTDRATTAERRALWRRTVTMERSQVQSVVLRTSSCGPA